MTLISSGVFIQHQLSSRPEVQQQYSFGSLSLYPIKQPTYERSLFTLAGRKNSGSGSGLPWQSGGCGEGEKRGSIGRQDNAHYGGKRTKKTQNHWDFIFRARRLFFLYTIRNNYSRRRRQTHPFLKVFIIKSSWDQWFQLAVDNHTQQQRGLHLGYLRPQSDRCLCFNFILRDPLPRSWTCCCSWGGREGKRYKWWSLNCWETMQTPSSVFSAPTPGSNWVWRWTGRLSSEGVWGRAWAGWEQEVYRHSKSQNLSQSSNPLWLCWELIPTAQWCLRGPACGTGTQIAFSLYVFTQYANWLGWAITFTC